MMGIFLYWWAVADLLGRRQLLTNDHARMAIVDTAYGGQEQTIVASKGLNHCERN